MSKAYEKPLISATLYYYDNEYTNETAEMVLAILKRYGFFPPHKIHAGKLTRNRFVAANEQTGELFVRAYHEKDIFGIDMASGDCKSSIDYWRIDWGFTYYKNSQLVGSCSLMPWNTFTMQSTYGRLQNRDVSGDFVLCFKELIKTLNPFYASIDDLQNKIALMGRAQEPHFIPNKIQCIYWGNYLGYMYYPESKIQSIMSLPICGTEIVGEGVFFALSDSLLDNRGIRVENLRRQIKHKLIQKSYD